LRCGLGIATPTRRGVADLLPETTVRKRMSREEHLRKLVETDENFRLLYERVSDLNGGRIPSSEEIDQRIQAWRERRASS
jgi:hypothetical protein